jgi:hypothetical protein
MKKVKIGNQEWMAKNLDSDHFRNGEIIPKAKNDIVQLLSGKVKLHLMHTGKSN